MFARIATVDLGPGMWDEGADRAACRYAGIATLPGLVDAAFFGDDGTGHDGAIGYRPTGEAAAAAGEHRAGSVQEALECAARRPSVVRIHPVDRPRARR